MTLRCLLLQIVDSVLELHAVAHAEGICSISVDIPPSAAARFNKAYGAVRQHVNEKLLATSLESKMRIHVPCPIDYYDEGETGQELWEDDGLHMSGPGYETLGRGLAPLVLGALKRWGVATS